MNEESDATDQEPRRAPIWLRVVALAAAVVLGLVAGGFADATVDLGGRDLCRDVVVGKCFDGSSGAQVATLLLAWPTVLAFAASALAAAYFAVTGRSWRLAPILFVVGLVLFGLSAVAARL